MSTSRKWILQPGIGAGDLVLGELLADVAARYQVDLSLPRESETRCESYEIRDDATVSLSVEDNRVFFLQFNDELFFLDQNLIGLTVQEFEELLGGPPEKMGAPIDMPDDTIQTTYEFDRLGIMLWVSEGRVVSVSVGEII